jgi:glycosyltransferase involved in cell wall biosynthesis
VHDHLEILRPNINEVGGNDSESVGGSTVMTGGASRQVDDSESRALTSGLCVQRRPTKLMVIVRSLDPGGAERQLIDVLAGLDKTAFKVSVLCFYRGRWHEQLVGVPGVELYVIGKTGRFDIFGFVARLLKLARKVQPDVTYGYMYVSDVLALLIGWLLRTPVVWGLRSSDLQTGHYDRISRTLQWLSRRLAYKADIVISNSSAGLRDFVRRGARVQSAVIIPNGIDTNRFAPSPIFRLQTRRAWGISQDARVIGIVARIDPMKGHDTFIEAARIIMEIDSNIWFVCVGASSETDGGYARSLRATASAVGVASRLIWVDHVELVETIYPALDVCTSTSRYGEGFSNSVGEAMACGVPCVVTDVGDSAKIVDDPRMVVPIGDANRLIAAWRLALLSGAEVGRRNRARIVEHFSRARCINLTADALARFAIR